MTRPDEELAASEPGGDLAPTERDLEAPPADAVEQSVSAKPVEEPADVSRGFEVGEWDAMEQSIVVDLEDDYDR